MGCLRKVGMIDNVYFLQGKTLSKYKEYNNIILHMHISSAKLLKDGSDRAIVLLSVQSQMQNLHN